MAFKHFIITRYNVKVKGWEETRDKEPIDDNWMRHRFELFRNYCFPSILNQSNQNFIWLLFLNDDTKEEFRNQLEELVAPHSNIKLVYINGSSEFYAQLCQSIGVYLKDEQYLITTRLDNDDAIRKDFIERIQRDFDNQKYALIEYPNGLSLQVEPKKMLAFLHDRLNPFISLIEEIEVLKEGIRFKTVMYYQQHRQWRESDVEVFSNTEIRPWLQIIHSKNKANTFKAKRLTGDKDLLDDFSIHIKDLEKPGITDQVMHYIKALISDLK